MIAASEVSDLLSHWWFSYDEAEYEELADLLCEDVTFQSGTDTGTTAYEEFVRCDVSGRDQMLAWQIDHRDNSPYPLRHNGTNVHLRSGAGDEAEFASYIFVSHLVEGAVTPLSTGRVYGTVRREGPGLRLAALKVVLDTGTSVPLSQFREAPATA